MRWDDIDVASGGVGAVLHAASSAADARGQGKSKHGTVLECEGERSEAECGPAVKSGSARRAWPLGRVAGRCIGSRKARRLWGLVQDLLIAAGMRGRLRVAFAEAFRPHRRLLHFDHPMNALDFSILFAFVAYGVWAGFAARRRASQGLEEYFLAGRSLAAGAPAAAWPPRSSRPTRRCW
jgi:hypothetical protein